eukprot:5529451-Amphidinium_carterae.1
MGLWLHCAVFGEVEETKLISAAGMVEFVLPAISKRSTGLADNNRLDVVHALSSRFASSNDGSWHVSLRMTGLMAGDHQL